MTDKAAVHLHRDGGVAVITIDNPPVNTIDAGVRAGLGRCLDDGLVSSGGSLERDLYNTNSVTLSILIGEATRWGDAEAWDADCLGVASDDTVRTATADVDLLQLFTPEGVVVSAPELYSATVTLRARLVD